MLPICHAPLWVGYTRRETLWNVSGERDNVERGFEGGEGTCGSGGQRRQTLQFVSLEISIVAHTHVQEFPCSNSLRFCPQHLIHRTCDYSSLKQRMIPPRYHYIDSDTLTKHEIVTRRTVPISRRAQRDSRKQRNRHNKYTNQEKIYKIPLIP